MTTDDPRAPLVVLQQKAWSALDETTRLRVIEFRRERNENGEQAWTEELQEDPPVEGEPEDSG
jgi:hypothetical protein